MPGLVVRTYQLAIWGRPGELHKNSGRTKQAGEENGNEEEQKATG